MSPLVTASRRSHNNNINECNKIVLGITRSTPSPIDCRACSWFTTRPKMSDIYFQVATPSYTVSVFRCSSGPDWYQVSFQQSIGSTVLTEVTQYSTPTNRFSKLGYSATRTISKTNGTFSGRRQRHFLQSRPFMDWRSSCGGVLEP